jgi:hypothetical protein
MARPLLRVKGGYGAQPPHSSLSQFNASYAHNAKLGVIPEVSESPIFTVSKQLGVGSFAPRVGYFYLNIINVDVFSLLGIISGNICLIFCHIAQHADFY